MKKSDLRTGMRVTLRNGETYYVMLNTGLSSNQGDVLIHKVGHDTGWMPLCQYDDDMLFHDDPDSGFLFDLSEENEEREWDIMKVETVRMASSLSVPSHYKTAWTLEE